MRNRLLSMCILLFMVFSMQSCSPKQSPKILYVEFSMGTGHCISRYIDENSNNLGNQPFLSVVSSNRIITDDATIKKFIDALSAVELEEWNEPIGNVEIIRLIFGYDDITHEYVDIIYDYESQQEFISYDRKAYLIKSDHVNDSIVEAILNRYGDSWWCRFANNDKHLFRYYQHWKDDRNDDPSKETYQYKSSGFKNTDPIEITSETDVIERAIDEIGIIPTEVYWYYDITTGYWMVRLVDKENAIDPFEKFEPFSRSSYCVVMDDKGVVLETYTDMIPFTHESN